MTAVALPPGALRFQLQRAAATDAIADVFLDTLRGVIKQFCRHMDCSQEWKHSVPGADQGFELDIDLTSFRKPAELSQQTYGPH